jgi:transposase
MAAKNRKPPGSKFCTKEQLCELINSGKNYKEIADILGCTSVNIWYLISSWGIAYDFSKRRKFTEETRRKMSESAKKRKATDETRRKISEAAIGRKFSEETIANMRIAAKKRCAEEGPRRSYKLDSVSKEAVLEALKNYDAKTNCEIKIELAKQFNMSFSTAVKLLKKYDITLPWY